MKSTDLVDNQYIRTDLPEFGPGDEVKVHVKVVEGNKERVQVFQGVVIRRQGSGVRESFSVRKISFWVGVERTFQDWRDLLAEPLDAVFVLTSGSHAPIAIAAGTNGAPDTLHCKGCGWEFDGWIGTKQALRATPPTLFLPTTESLHQWLNDSRYGALFGDGGAAPVVGGRSPSRSRDRRSGSA